MGSWQDRLSSRESHQFILGAYAARTGWCATSDGQNDSQVARSREWHNLRPGWLLGVQVDDSSIVLPVSDEKTIAQFCETFGLLRGHESGLSIVVPFYDEDEITTETILHAVVIGYFYPILSGELVVEIVGPDNVVTTLDQSNLADAANRFDHSRPLMPVIQLSDWARSIKESDILSASKVCKPNSLQV